MRKLLSRIFASVFALSFAVTPVVPANAGEIYIPRPATAQPNNEGLQTVQYRRRGGGGVRWHGSRGMGGARWHGPRGGGAAWRGPRGGGAVRWHGPRGGGVRWAGPRRGAAWHGMGGRNWHGPRGGVWRGGVWRGNNFYWHGRRGYRHFRPGYRYYNGWWFPSAAFVGGAIVGGALAAPNTYYMGGNSHAQWCYNRYRSYRSSDNTFQPYNGPRQQCISPFGG